MYEDSESFPIPHPHGMASQVDLRRIRVRAQRRDEVRIAVDVQIRRTGDRYLPSVEDLPELPRLMTDEALIDELVRRGLDDWVMAAEVGFVVKEHSHLMGDDEIRGEMLACVRDVVELGLMVIGDVTDTGFVAWEGTQREALARAEAILEARASLPTLGEMCWLSNTPAGDKRAREAS